MKNAPAPYRNNRLQEEVAREAARFLLEHSTKKALITVTRASLTEHAERATIFLTVFPETYEKEALAFTKRKRGEFHEHLHNHARLSRVPFVEFAIDRGEKNRQCLDEISSKK